MRLSRHRPSTRELKRIEKRQAKRGQQTQKPQPMIPVFLWADQMFSPIDNILAQIELTGELETDEHGTVICRAATGEIAAAWGAVDGVAELFDQWRIRHNAALDISPLRQLASRFDYGMPVDQPLLDAVRELMPRLRAIASRMAADQVDSLILGAHIRNAQERLATGRG